MGTSCCGIIPLHTAKICHCDWFNKEADWPIAEQDKVRPENQTKTKKGRVKELPVRQEEKMGGAR